MLPDTKDTTVTVPGMTGVYDYGAYLGARMIELECAFVDARSPAELQQAVRRFAAHLVDTYGRPRVMPLRLDWEPGVEYMVRYSGSLAIERLAALGTFTLPLLAADPYAYGNLEQYQFIVNESPTTVTIGNKGNTPTPVQLVIKNQGTTPINGFTLTRYQIE